MRFVRDCLAHHKDKKEINDVEVGLSWRSFGA